MVNPPKVILDSNILISAYVFGGKPKKVLLLAIEDKIKPIISLSLITELIEVLSKKFNVKKDDVLEIEEEIKNNFEFVYPVKTIRVARDEDDNRVLEAAVEGRCDFIITGDKDLLLLRKYKHIHIVTAEEFLFLYYEDNKM